MSESLARKGRSAPANGWKEALWRFGKGWSCAEIEPLLAGVADLPLNFSTPREEMTRENGWKYDPYETELCREPPGPPAPEGFLARAREVLGEYRLSDPRMIEGHFDRSAPLQGRNMLLEMKAAGFHFLCPVRVTRVWDETDERRTCFGFEYVTLQGHLERGYERFFVTQEHATGCVRFRLEDHWTYGDFPNWWSHAGFVTLGWVDRHIWARLCARRLRRLAGAPHARE